MTRPAFVQTEFDFEIREINALEIRIVTAEDDADAMLWEQAQRVVAQLPPRGASSTRKLAALWINTRANPPEPYSHLHVHRVKVVFDRYFEVTPRPRFRDAYNEVTNVGRHGHLEGDYEWYTPAPIVEAARLVMGAIDLDPASCAPANDVVKAATYYSEADDGLAQLWAGRVFLNPPFAHPTVKHFAEKLLASLGPVTEAVWVSNACVDTDWWHALARQGALCFPLGRLKFYSPDGQLQPPTLGQSVIYLGPQRDKFREAFSPFGMVLP